LLPDLTLHLVAGTIPSPSDGVWELGPVPIRGYALCIIAGIIAAIWIGERRWVARGGRPGDVQDIAIWAVPFGIVGARLYHVATDWECYFDQAACVAADKMYGGPWAILYVWRGGLGIWGGVALGALGAYLGCRAKGIRFLPMADALAPGLLVAQAIGRWGNWFNQELFGGPTDLPWALEVSPDTALDAGYEIGTTFHPTFLYECLWNLAAFVVVLWLERRFRLGYGRVMAVYVMAYTLGRAWIEYLRVDDVQLDNVLGLRFNVWTSIVLFVAAAIFLVVSTRRHPGREESVYRDGSEPAEAGPEDGPEAGPEEGPEEGPEDDAAEPADVSTEAEDVSTED